MPGDLFYAAKVAVGAKGDNDDDVACMDKITTADDMEGILSPQMTCKP